MQLLSSIDLSYAYGPRQVLHKVSLEIQKGGIVGVLGPNGAGKTTLFQLLSGQKALQGGEIRFLGTKIAGKGQTASPWMRAQMGVVFQEPSLDGRLSALENLQLCGQLFGVKKSDLEKRSKYFLTKVGLWERALEPVKRWSVGMRRQLELVRALLHAPRCLLMDEPTASLDHAHVVQAWQLLSVLAKEEQVGICLVTHRMEEADNCDRLFVLHNGKVVACDTPAAIKSRVKGDQVVFELEKSPEEKDAFARRLDGIPHRLEKNRIHAVAQEGHLLVPRVVERLPMGMVKAVHMRKPTLADAYLQLTGENL